MKLEVASLALTFNPPSLLYWQEEKLMLRSPALFGRLLRALRSNRTAVHVLPSIRVSFSTVSRINTSGKAENK